MNPNSAVVERRGTPDFDRNLLFVVIALQNGFIDQADLIAAFHAWAADKAKPLGQILVERGALEKEEHELVEVLIRKHLKKYGEDVRATLAAVADAAARDAIRSIGDPEVSDSLSSLPPAAGYVLVETLAPRPEQRHRYTLTRLHAQGGLGRVWLARDTDLNRDVALKEILPNKAAHPEMWRRFLKEAQVTGQLEHPNIVPVYELARRPEDNEPFYTMRFVRGRTLRQAIADYHGRRSEGQTDPLEQPRLLQAFTSVCQAIGYAHSRGVIHRDLKPDNVLLGGFGEVLVLDWGLAKMVDRPDDDRDLASLSITGEAETDATREGQYLGTPSYMAPEQAEGRIDLIDARTDIYGLGAILFEILTGRAPHGGPNLHELISRIATGETPRARSVSPSVPAALDAICARAMARAREERYAKATDLADDVSRWLADEPVSAHREGISRRLARWSRRHRAWVQAGAATLLIVSLVSVVALALIDAARRGERGQKLAVIEEGKKTRQALDQVLEANDVIESQVARSFLDRGLDLCAKADSRGLLWIARGLEHVPAKNPNLDALIRRELAAWGSTAHLPTSRSKRPFRFANGQFSPDGRMLAVWDIAGSGGNIPVWLWDCKSDRQVGAPLIHEDLVSCVAFSSDGRLLATGTHGNVARVWDAATGRPVTPNLVHEGDVESVAFSPDGKTLATGSYDKTARVWDSSTGQPTSKPLVHPDAVTAVAFSLSGALLVTGANDRMVRFWDVATGRVTGEPLALQGGATSLAFSPDGKTLATGDHGGTARLWAVGTGRALCPPLTHKSFVERMLFSPDGRTFVTVEYLGEIHVWKAATGQPSHMRLTHENGVTALAISSDGKLIASGDMSGNVKLWELANGRPIGLSLAHEFFISAVGFTSDAKTLVSRDHDSVRLWDISTTRPIHFPEPPPAATEVLSAEVSPDGQRLAILIGEQVHLLTATADRVLATFEDFKWPVVSMAFAPDGKTLAIGGKNGRAQVRSAATGDPAGPILIHEPSEKEYEIAAVAYSPDGKILATGCWDLTIKLWDVATGRRVGADMTQDTPVRAVQFSPDGRLLLARDDAGVVGLWDITTGQQIVEPPYDGDGISAERFSPDSKLIATGNREGVVKLWDVETGRYVGMPMVHERRIHALAFSPDGKTLAAGSSDWTARLWDVSTQRAMALPLNHTGFVTSVEFSRDGRLLATGTVGRTARFWDVATGVPVGPPLAHGGRFHDLMSHEDEHRPFSTDRNFVRFSADGRMLLTAGCDFDAVLWPVVPPIASEPKALTAWCEWVTGLKADDPVGVYHLSADESEKRGSAREVLEVQLQMSAHAKKLTDPGQQPAR